MGSVNSTSRGVSRLIEALSIEGVPHVSTVPSSPSVDSESDRERERQDDFVELSEEARQRKQAAPVAES
jgi:hypothetical protein